MPQHSAQDSSQLPPFAQLGWLGRFIGLILLICRCLPAELCWKIGANLGAFFGNFSGRDQKRCHEHLSLAFPHFSQKKIQKNARKCFAHYGGMTLWTFSNLHRHPQKVLRGCTIENRKNLKETLGLAKKGQGSIFMTGHYGNWEMLGRLVGSYSPLTVFARRQRNKDMDALISWIRCYDKNRIAYQEDDIRTSINEIRNGQLIGILPDQDVNRLSGCFVPWFGKLAYTPMGLAALAALAPCAVQPLFLMRSGARWLLHAGPRLTLNPEIPRSEAMLALTANCMAYHQAIVSRCPEQWAWWHRRWRTQPVDKPKAKIYTTLA